MSKRNSFTRDFVRRTVRRVKPLLPVAREETLRLRAENLKLRRELEAVRQELQIRTEVLQLVTHIGVLQ